LRKKEKLRRGKRREEGGILLLFSRKKIKLEGKRRVR